MKLTEKQKKVLMVVVRANPDGTFCDLDQVIERVPYKTTKASIQFIVRNLIGKGLIEKVDTEARRNRRRIILGPTAEGYKLVSQGRLSGFEELGKIIVEASGVSL